MELAGASTPRTAAVSAPRGLPYVAYVTQPGDTLVSLAESFGVKVAHISRESAIEDPDLLPVGQLLTIPRVPGKLYRVQSGETLEQVAAMWGTTSPLLASVNAVSGTLQAGDVLLIPDHATAASTFAGK